MEVQEAIRVRDVVIVDADGKARMRLGEIGEGEFGLALFNKNGEAQVLVSQHEQSWGVRIVCDNGLGAEVTGNRIELQDGSVVTEVPVIRAQGWENETSIDLTVDRLGDPSLILWGKSGAPRVQIQGAAVDCPHVSICDQTGTERIRMGDLLGRPVLDFADDTGIADMEISRDRGFVLPNE